MKKNKSKLLETERWKWFVRLTPPCCGQSGLSSLVMDARSEYIEHVVGKGKLYRRYVSDFLHSHCFHDAADAVSKNDHRKNLGVVEELLSDHPDLVGRYFLLPDFGQAEIDELIYQVDFPKSARLAPLRPYVATPPLSPSDFECILCADSLSLLASCANEINLFREEVTAQDLQGIFSCAPSRVLTARHNGLLATFFAGLAARGFITSTWQRLFSLHTLVYTSSGKRPLVQKSLSAALYQITQKKTPSVVRKLFLQLDRIQSMQKQQ